MARIKAWLFLNRNTTRDYLDTVVLFEKLQEAALKGALSTFEAIYGPGPGGGHPLVELAERLAAAAPSDRAEIDLSSYKGLKAPWVDWRHLEDRGRSWAAFLAGLVLGA